MRSLRSDRRRGMTLIELVVVISLILLLAALALMISPRLAEDQRSVRSADLVSGWLLMCKQRAYRDQQTRGVRLLVQNANAFGNRQAGAEVRECQLIERPEDYRGGVLQVPSPFRGQFPDDPPPPQANATAFVHGKDLTNNNPPDVTAERIVDAGDFLVFDTLEQIPYNSHRIYSLNYVPPGANPQAPAGGTHIVCATYDKVRYSAINGGVPIYNLRSEEFRFVRQPRPLAGEPNLQLPRDMIIDLTPESPSYPTPVPAGTLEGGTILPGGPPLLSLNSMAGAIDQYDILFSPRGQVQGSNSVGGKIILRIRNGTRSSRDGDQIHVVIYTRSGIIASHPVNLTSDAAGNLIDAYGFLRDGYTSGF